MPPEDDLNAWVAGTGADPLNDWVNPPPEQAARARGLGAALDIVPEESAKAHHPAELAPLSSLPEGVEPTEGMKAQGGHFPFETEDLPRLQKRLSEAGVDADTIQKTMQQFRSPQAVQGRQFDRAVKEAARQPEDWTRYVVGKLPIAGGMADYLQSQAGQETAARFQAGQATQQDIERLAREQVAGAREEAKGAGRKVVDMAAGLPAFLTEWSMLGGPAGYLGKAAEGAVLGERVAPSAARLAAAQAAKFGGEVAGRTAAQAALQPEVAAQREQDARFPGGGMASAFLENLIWTAAGGPAPKPGATAAGGLVTNYLRTQAAAEANKAGQSLLSGKGGGSTLQQLANARTDKERDKALSDLAAEAAVFGGLAGAHAIPGAVEALKPAEREWLQHSIMDSLTPEPELLPPLSPLEGIGMLRPEGQSRFAGTPQQGFTPQEAPGAPPAPPQPAPAPTPASAPPTPPAQSQTPSRTPLPQLMPQEGPSDAQVKDWRAALKSMGVEDTKKMTKQEVVAQAKTWGMSESVQKHKPPPEAPQPPREPPPPKKGMVRFYHGAADNPGDWLTPDRQYAEGYANKSEGGKTYYVDVPEGHPSLRKAFDDEGTNMKAPYTSFQAPADIADRLKPLPRLWAPGTGGPVDTPQPPMEPPATPKRPPVPGAPAPPQQATSPKELLDRIDRGEGGLTLAEKKVLQERLLWGTSFREIGAGMGVSHETVRDHEQAALSKLGHEGTVDELHLRGQGGQALAKVENSDNVRGTDVHEATETQHNAAINLIDDAMTKLDRLDRRRKKEMKLGPLKPERKSYFLAEARRLHDVINQGSRLGANQAGPAAGEPGPAEGEPAPAQSDGGRGPAPGGPGGPDQAEAAGAGAAPAGPETGARGAGAPEPAGGAAAGMKEAWEAGKKVGVLGDYNPGASLKEKLNDFGRVDTENLDDIYARLKPGAGSSNERLRVLSSAYDSLLAEAQGRLPPTADRINKRMDAVKRGIEEVVPQLRDIGGMGAAADFYEKYGPGLVEEARQDLLGRVGGAEPAGQHPNVAAGKPFAMGAAALGELTPAAPGEGPRGPTALANAKIDAERLARGQSPIIGSARMENSEAWDQAMRRLDADPDLGRKLAEEIADKPRPLDVVEQAVLLHEKIRLSNEARQLGQQILEAQERGGLDAQDLDALKDRVDAAERARYELDLAAKRTGTELGRSLAFRRQLAAEDYSLEGLTGRAMAAKGAPLTAEERAQFEDLSKRILELQRQLAEAEARGERPVEPRSGKVSELGKADEKVRDEADTAVADLREKAKPTREKVADLFTKVRINEVISSLTTLAKLPIATIQRVATYPAYEAVGALVRRLPGAARIALMAPREGRGLSPAVEVKAFYSAVTEGMKDAWQTFRTGKSELDVRHKSGSPTRTWLDMQFSLHDALKAPAVRNEYTRSYLQRTDAAALRGEDVTSPASILERQTAAYADAQRAKFRGENWLVDATNGALTPKPGASLGEFVAKKFVKGAVVPVLRIPTNIVTETGQHIFGVGTGTFGAIRAYARGIETLKPAEADLIMRQWKRGSLGLGLLALGYFKPDLAGGYYQDDEKRREGGEPKVGAVKLGGVELPAWTQHNPLLQTLQFGATVRRVEDSLHKGEPRGIGAGALAGVLGLGAETPQGQAAKEAYQAFSAKERGWFLGQSLKSLTVPQLVQWLAGQQDTDPGTGEPTKRRPEGVLEHIETGVPWLRQRVEAR